MHRVKYRFWRSLISRVFLLFLVLASFIGTRFYAQVAHRDVGKIKVDSSRPQLIPMTNYRVENTRFRCTDLTDTDLRHLNLVAFSQSPEFARCYYTISSQKNYFTKPETIIITTHVTSVEFTDVYVDQGILFWIQNSSLGNQFSSNSCSVDFTFGTMVQVQSIDNRNNNYLCHMSAEIAHYILVHKLLPQARRMHA